MEIIFLLLLPLIICPMIASSKGRSVGGWFFGGCIIGWIGVIIVACLSSRKQKQETVKPYSSTKEVKL